MDVNLFMPRSDDTCESHGISNGQLLEILGNGFSCLSTNICASMHTTALLAFDMSSCNLTCNGAVTQSTCTMQVCLHRHMPCSCTALEATEQNPLSLRPHGQLTRRLGKL